jgi:DNA-binding GntR family transcriptional regulator
VIPLRSKVGDSGVPPAAPKTGTRRILSDSTRFTVRRFSDDFARLLRERIMSGELRAGERLNEVKLSEQYGISRSPIREALQALSGEGLVTFVAGRGAYVNGPSVEDVREYGQVREALEVQAIALVVAAASADDIEALAASVGVVQHANRAPDASKDFHAVLLRVAGNARLQQYASHVASQLRLARAQSATRPGRVDEAADEHRVILDALQRGDAQAATDAMRSHIRQATENACAALEAARAAG